MKKILFACDLDNTLIHSYRHKEKNDICVELYQKREQSFISQEAVHLFRKMTEQKAICFVPVTTRSVSQYQRIFFPDGYRPEMALAANGYILLKHDEPEPEWLASSYQQVESCLPELIRLEQMCLADNRFRHVHIADGLFLACACEAVRTADACLADYAAKTELQVFRTGRKLYFFQPEYSKGTALQKFRELYPADIVIAAGDSEMDLPMSEYADIFLFKENQPDFAEYILSYILDTVLL